MNGVYNTRISKAGTVTMSVVKCPMMFLNQIQVQNNCGNKINQSETSLSFYAQYIATF